MQAAALVPAPAGLVLWGRATVLGTAALGSGVLSHVAGGGRLPSAVTLGLLLAGAVLLASRLVRVRRTAAGLVLLVLGGQTLGHALLSGLAGHRGDPSSDPTGAAAGGGSVTVPVAPPPSEHTGNLHDLYTASYTPPLPAAEGSALPVGWLGHQVDHLLATGPTMVLAHLAGAVALGLFLAVGESALWRLILLGASRVRVAVAAWRVVLAADGVLRGVRLAGARLHPRAPQLRVSQVLARQGPRRRGPPLLLAA